MARRPPRTVSAVLGTLLVVLVLGLIAWGRFAPPISDGLGNPIGTRDPAATGAASELATVGEADLPASAQQTLELIDAGGPYPYEQDGSVFGNREGLLPNRETGYYREYTVRKPGEDDRGPWRIVTGGDPAQEFYWTEDHYQSFLGILR